MVFRKSVNIMIYEYGNHMILHCQHWPKELFRSDLTHTNSFCRCKCI